MLRAPACWLAWVLVLAPMAEGADTPAEEQGDSRRMVLVELYTSQG